VGLAVIRFSSVQCTSTSQIEGMQWIRSHLTADGKHSFCEFEAPSAAACRQHAQLAGLPVDEVVAIGKEIGPKMFT
jgi:uncharacterized protein DUF4242